MRHPETWEGNVRKKQRQAGEQYVNVKGVQVPKKEMLAISCIDCRCKCSAKIPEHARATIFSDFWSLIDTAKDTFYAKFTEKHEKQRVCTKAEEVVPFFIFFSGRGCDIEFARNFFVQLLQFQKLEFHISTAEFESGNYVRLIQRSVCREGTITSEDSQI